MIINLLVDIKNKQESLEITQGNKVYKIKLNWGKETLRDKLKNLFNAN